MQGAKCKVRSARCELADDPFRMTALHPRGCGCFCRKSIMRLRFVSVVIVMPMYCVPFKGYAVRREHFKADKQSSGVSAGSIASLLSCGVIAGDKSK